MRKSKVFYVVIPRWDYEKLMEPGAGFLNIQPGCICLPLQASDENIYTCTYASLDDRNSTRPIFNPNVDDLEEVLSYALRLPREARLFILVVMSSSCRATRSYDD